MEYRTIRRMPHRRSNPRAATDAEPLVEDGLMANDTIDAENERIEARRGAAVDSITVEERDRPWTVAAEETEANEGPDDLQWFRPIPTVPAASVAMISSVLMILAVFLIPAILDDYPSVDSFSALIYCHSVWWVVHLFVDPYLKRKHKLSRIRGYIGFYLKTKNTRRAPFYVISFGNFALLLTVTALHDYCDVGGGGSMEGPDGVVLPTSGSCPDPLTKVDWIRSVITIEALLVVTLYIYYIHRVYLFNKAKKKPDIMRDDVMRKLKVNLALVFDVNRPPVIYYQPAPVRARQEDEEEDVEDELPAAEDQAASGVVVGGGQDVAAETPAAAGDAIVDGGATEGQEALAREAEALDAEARAAESAAQLRRDLNEEAAFQMFMNARRSNWAEEELASEHLCELVRFLIQQCQRKNEKIVALVNQLDAVEQSNRTLMADEAARRSAALRSLQLARASFNNPRAFIGHPPPNYRPPMINPNSLAIPGFRAR